MYLTEIIRESGQKVEEWGEGKNMILLEAPTGSGKTYFVQRILPELCRQNDSQMAIIVNRRILREQMERYDKEYMLENNLTVSPVKIMTYQQIESDQDKKILDYLENCEFVVLDEARYLVNDVLFNPSDERSFLKLMGLVDRTCLILMTATPGNLRLLLDGYLDWWNQKRADEYSQKSAEHKERRKRHGRTEKEHFYRKHSECWISIRRSSGSTSPTDGSARRKEGAECFCRRKDLDCPRIRSISGSMCPPFSEPNQY